MIAMIRHIIRGCGTLPTYGPHPGTGTLFMFVVMGALAGLQGGLLGMFCGAAAMLALFVVPYLWGAYDRSLRDPDPRKDRAP